MNLIIGLNAFHPDAAACALKDGKLVAAVTEERLGKRTKHVAGFPNEALLKVLQMAGATIRDVDYIALGYDSNANLPAKVAHVLRTPIESVGSVLTHFQRRGKMRGFKEMVAETCGVAEADCRFEVMRVEHHLAHLASSYYASDFDTATGYSYDGAGDFASAMQARCEGNEIKVLGRVMLPHSLGFFYTTICHLLGFDRFGEEYKMMGLAAYGQPSQMELMKDFVRSNGSGQFRLNSDYYLPLKRGVEECVGPDGEIVLPPMYTDALVQRAGPVRARKAELSQRDMDLAASCQQHFEDVVIKSLNWLHEQNPTENLVTAGGCALNGVCNARILRDTPFRKSYIHSAASDDGTAVGAALYVWNTILKRVRGGAIEHAYWGPDHDEAEMEEALEAAGVPFEKLSRPDLLARTADYLANGRVVGWYQGRSEWGPRALGNRSILAHPGWPGMKDLINRKIKRREAFRPFAPTILAEEVPNYFEQNVESPFMMHVVKIRPEKREALSAVCHEDFTGRLHTVKRSQNEIYYDLISAFRDRTGVAAVLNTSLNENEPIVDTPAQAVSCFVRTDIDVLVVGPYITVKQGRALPAEASTNGSGH